MRWDPVEMPSVTVPAVSARTSCWTQPSTGLRQRRFDERGNATAVESRSRRLTQHLHRGLLEVSRHSMPRIASM